MKRRLLVGGGSRGCDDGCCRLRIRRRSQLGADGFEGQTLTVWAMDGSTPEQWEKDVKAAFKKKTGRQARSSKSSSGTASSRRSPPPCPSRPAGRHRGRQHPDPRLREDGRPRGPRRPQEDRRRGLDGVRQQVRGVRRQAVRGPLVRRQPHRHLQQEDLGGGGHQEDPEDPRRVLRGSRRDREEDRRRADLSARPELVLLRRPPHRQGRRPGEEAGRQVGLQPRRPRGRRGHEALQEVRLVLQGPEGQGRGHAAAGGGLRQGQTGAFIGLGWEAATAIEANPDIKKDIGYFTIPGETRRQARRRLPRRLQPRRRGGQREAGTRKGVPEDRAVRQVRGSARRGGRRDPEQGIPPDEGRGQRGRRGRRPRGGRGRHSPR